MKHLRVLFPWALVVLSGMTAGSAAFFATTRLDPILNVEDAHYVAVWCGEDLVMSDEDREAVVAYVTTHHVTCLEDEVLRKGT